MGRLCLFFKMLHIIGLCQPPTKPTVSLHKHTALSSNTMADDLLHHVNSNNNIPGTMTTFPLQHLQSPLHPFNTRSSFHMCLLLSHPLSFLFTSLSLYLINPEKRCAVCVSSVWIWRLITSDRQWQCFWPELLQATVSFTWMDEFSVTGNISSLCEWLLD